MYGPFPQLRWGKVGMGATNVGKPRTVKPVDAAYFFPAATSASASASRCL